VHTQQLEGSFLRSDSIFLGLGNVCHYVFSINVMVKRKGEVVPVL
jgi:hypothetical protein